MMSDFDVASNGHCFFCLSPIMALKRAPNVPPRPTNSLQYLSRYLKIDQKKVFIDREHVSPELLAKVENATLKVELCDECRCLSETFAKVYRQLEKLQMELGSTLSLIREKLVSEDATSNLTSFSSNWSGLLDVMDVLREEVIQKGSKKLTVNPQVKLQKLSKKEIRARQIRLEIGNSFDRKQENSQLTTNTDFVADGFNMESVNDECLSDNDSGNNLSDDDNSNQDIKPFDDDAEIGKKRVKRDVNVVDKIVVSRAAAKGFGAGKCSINPETGKRRCNTCNKEYSRAGAFKTHYQTDHLKIRYKCISCNKLFSKKGHLIRHQLTSQSCSTTESAPKFNCHLCKKSFSLKHHLADHLDAIHYKLQKYKCDVCEKKFNAKSHVRAHKRQVHRKRK